MEASISNYTNAVGSVKQAYYAKTKRKGGRGMREGWEYKKLGEVAIYPNKRMSLTNISGQQYVGVETLVKDRGGVAFSEELPNVDTAIEFLENDILIGNIRPYLKKIWKADRHGASSGDVVNIRIAENFKGRLDSSFLYKVLSSDSFFEYDNSNTHGAKMPRGDRKAIAEFKIPIPPLSTQHSIVSELDKINELIRLKKEQLKDYDNLAQSIFYEMFGDPVVNEKGWEVKKFADLYKLKSGDSLSAKNFVEGEIPVYGGNGISGYHNDFNMDGDFIIIGRVGVYCGNVREVHGKFWLTDNAFQLFYNREIQYPCFIHYLLEILDLHKYANAAAQPVISNLTLKDVEIIIPPLSLQQLFAQRIELIEKQKEEVQRTIKDLETLLASRMQYWFD